MDGSRIETGEYASKLPRRIVAETFGLSARALRYYEYMELVTPERIENSALYSPRDLARLKLILRGRRFGLRLEDIRLWLNIYDQQGEAAQLKAWLEISSSRIAGIKQEITDLQDVLADLEGLHASSTSALKGLEAEALNAINE